MREDYKKTLRKLSACVTELEGIYENHTNMSFPVDADWYISTQKAAKRYDEKRKNKLIRFINDMTERTRYYKKVSKDSRK